MEQVFLFQKIKEVLGEEKEPLEVEDGPSFVSLDVKRRITPQLSQHQRISETFFSKNMMSNIGYP